VAREHAKGEESHAIFNESHVIAFRMPFVIRRETEEEEVKARTIGQDQVSMVQSVPRKSAN